jgi:hypothetical protein
MVLTNPLQALLGQMEASQLLLHLSEQEKVCRGEARGVEEGRATP